MAEVLVWIVRELDGRRITRKEWMKSSALASRRLIEECEPGELIQMEVIETIE
jgi:hypothetical protein